MEEPPVVQAPKPLLSGAVPLEAFLATLQKVWNLQTSVSMLFLFAVLSLEDISRSFSIPAWALHLIPSHIAISQWPNITGISTLQQRAGVLPPQTSGNKTQTIFI